MAKKDSAQAIKEEATTRPPIVVILGHVDHGKTSILDRIRSSKIADKEAGGITQHIGAYQIEHEGKKITFLDTPGHEAFTAIRSRGAKVADIAILVVAADEGVKPQTKEAIRIINETATPFIVAINKIDKEGANPARVHQELAEQQVFVEGYGGQVPVIELSAKTGQGINELLEMILLVAELEAVTTEHSGLAEGIIIDSRKDSRRGILATAIIQKGILHVGDYIAAGSAFGRIKALENFLGKSITSAQPSEPCIILGWETMPYLGQTVQAMATRDLAEKAAIAAQTLGTTLFAHEALKDKKVANLTIKADVNSSLEAIDHVLRTITSEEVDYKVVSYGIGAISISDVQNAQAIQGSVIGFNVAIEDSARQLAEREHIIIKSFNIIYELVETVRSIMSELLEPEIKRNDLGKLKVLALFKSDGKSQIVGCRVTQGKALRGSLIDVFRSGVLILQGKLGQLQHNKADVAEVSEGMELGMRFDPIKIVGINPRVHGIVAVGDVLEVYSEEKIKRSL